jgi:hypothetical protein
MEICPFERCHECLYGLNNPKHWLRSNQVWLSHSVTNDVVEEQSVAMPEDSGCSIGHSNAKSIIGRLEVNLLAQARLANDILDIFSFVHATTFKTLLAVLST